MCTPPLLISGRMLARLRSFVHQPSDAHPGTLIVGLAINDVPQVLR